MDGDGRSRVFSFFAAERKKFKCYVHRKIQSISDMDAEDIVGEVMLGIIDKANLTGHVENLAAYVYRSLYNKIIDFQRRNSKTVSLHSLIDEDGETSLIDLLADNSSNTCSGIERKETLQRLADAVSSLEPRQRAVFIATEMKGQSFKELSMQWNVPIGTLLSRKCRAVKALREMLGDLRI